MGDVFDAMNRAKQESPGRAPAAPAFPAAPTVSPAADPGAADDVQPSLHLAPPAPGPDASGTAPAPQPPASVTAVADAVDRAAQDQTLDRPGAVSAIGAMQSASHSARNGYSPQIIVHHDRGSIVTEQYRAVRTQILARCKNRRLQVHVITSAAPGEGKTVSALNLGMTFAEIRNQKTLLVEGDLRRPTFSQYFGRPISPGMMQFLNNETDDVTSIIHPTVYDNLQFIPAGCDSALNSTEMLSSPRMVRLLDRLKDRYDFIFIDSPPVVTVTDPCILGAMADQTLMVVRLNKTPSELIDRAKRLLRASNCELAGVILTHMRPDLSPYAYRYAYGGYYYNKKRS